MKFFKNIFPWILYFLVCFYVLKSWFFKEPTISAEPLDYSGQVYNYPKTELEASIPNTKINFQVSENDSPEELYTLPGQFCDFVISTVGACLVRVDYHGALASNGKPLRVNYGDRFAIARHGGGTGPVGTLSLLTESPSPVNFNVVKQTKINGVDAMVFTGQNEFSIVEKTFFVGQKPYELNMIFRVVPKVLQQASNECSTLDSTVRLILCPLQAVGSSEEVQALFYNSNSGQFCRKNIDLTKDFAVKFPNYFGFESKYYSSLLQCEKELGDVSVFSSKGYFSNYDKGLLAMVEIKASTANDSMVKLYAGPRNMGALLSCHPKADQTVDFGWFDMLWRFLIKLLEWLTQLVGNIGFAIILLAIFTKVAMFPLALYCKSRASAVLRFEKHYASTIAQIEKTFAKDKVKQADELNKFYQQHGVSMMQKSFEFIPPILSLFLILPAYSIFGRYEIFYKAPFLFWIKDLSAKDPYMIMPIFLGLLFLSRMVSDDTIKKLGIMSFVLLLLPIYFLSGAPSATVLWIGTTIILDAGEKLLIAKILRL